MLKKGRNGLNGARYVDQILKGPMKSFYDEMRDERGPGVLVVEDGAPPHRAKVSQNACKDLGINSLKHPPSSPDLNPIEPLWNILKDRVGKIPGSYHSVDTLWTAAQKVWDEFTEDDLAAAMGSMEERVDAIVKAKGSYTQF